jgi:hypothetical protein
MQQRDPVANGRAVIHHIHGICGESDCFHEGGDHLGIVLEGVLKGRVIRHAALAVAGIVWSHQAEGTGQPRDQIAKHIGRSGKAVEEQDHRRSFGTRFAVKDVQVIHADGFVMNRVLSARGVLDCGHRIVLHFLLRLRKSKPHGDNITRTIGWELS